MTTTPEDPYQDRYEKHQSRKRAVLAELVAERHSERRFADEPLDPDALVTLIDAAQRTASSCDRKGVWVNPVTDRDTKALLGGLLVGGVGWIHRAPAVLMLFADPVAYKAGDEIAYMPYLDAGVIVGQLYLAATALDLAACFVNPNVREAHKELFRAHFGGELYCGALAVGHQRADIVKLYQVPPSLGDAPCPA